MNQENESALDLYLSNLKPLKFKRVLNLQFKRKLNLQIRRMLNLQFKRMLTPVKSVECPSPQNVERVGPLPREHMKGDKNQLHVEEHMKIHLWRKSQT